MELQVGKEISSTGTRERRHGPRIKVLGPWHMVDIESQGDTMVIKGEWEENEKKQPKGNA